MLGHGALQRLRRLRRGGWPARPALRGWRPRRPDAAARALAAARSAHSCAMARFSSSRRPRRSSRSAAASAAALRWVASMSRIACIKSFKSFIVTPRSARGIPAARRTARRESAAGGDCAPPCSRPHYSTLPKDCKRYLCNQGMDFCCKERSCALCGAQRPTAAKSAAGPRQGVCGAGFGLVFARGQLPGAACAARMTALTGGSSICPERTGPERLRAGGDAVADGCASSRPGAPRCGARFRGCNTRPGGRGRFRRYARAQSRQASPAAPAASAGAGRGRPGRTAPARRGGCRTARGRTARAVRAARRGSSSAG